MFKGRLWNIGGYYRIDNELISLYTCNICKMKYILEDNLDLHIRLNHYNEINKKYFCSICDKFSRTLHEATQHYNNRLCYGDSDSD